MALFNLAKSFVFNPVSSKIHRVFNRNYHATTLPFPKPIEGKLEHCFRYPKTDIPMTMEIRNPCCCMLKWPIKICPSFREQTLCCKRYDFGKCCCQRNFNEPF